MKKILSLTLAMLTACSFCACQGTTAEAPLTDEPLGTNAVYDVLGIGEIPVGMWFTPPDGYRTMDAFKKIADCGITMVNGFPYSENTEEEVNFVLDACQEYNLRFLYSSLQIEENIREYNKTKDPQIIENTMAEIDKFASHPAYAGQLFIDEPSISYFDTLADFYNAYRTKYTDKLPYVNMLPYYALGGTGCSRYEDYVDTWYEKVNPSFYSYDSYPLVDYDPSVIGYEAEMSDFYYNLDLLRAKTLEQGTPMWSFVATEGYKKADGSPEPDRRQPSREDFRWQVFSNLAFGSKCIQYWCYWTPGGDVTTALVDRGGNPTETYYHAQEVNAEFKNYSPFLLNADAVGVMMSDYRRGGYEIYTTPLTKFGAIKSVEGNRYVIGCFSDKDTGKKSVLITPTTPRDDIEVTMTMHSSVKEVTAYVGGVAKTLKVKNNKLKVKVNHGDAVYIQL